MLIAKTIAEVRAAVAALRADKKCIGAWRRRWPCRTPRISLVRAAKERCGAVVVTIFVDPMKSG